MEARKLHKKEVEQLGIYKVRRDTTIIVEVDITKKEYDWIYENIMYDDVDCAYENGMMFDDYQDNYCLDCGRVLQQFDIWLEETEDNGEKFEDYNKEFKNTFNKLKALLEELREYTLYYDSVTKVTEK